MAFGEKVSNFFSYLTFFGFVVLVGITGFYFYNKYHTTASEEVSPKTEDSSNPAAPTAPVEPVLSKSSLPSEFLQPVMQAELPVIFGPISDKIVDLGPAYAELSARASAEKGKPGDLRAAWSNTAQLCQEMSAALAQRNAIVAAHLKPTTSQGSSAAPLSQADQNDARAKQEFFKKTSALRWSSQAVGIKRKISSLYQRVLTEENKAR